MIGYRVKVELWDERDERVAVAWTEELPNDAPLSRWRSETRHLWSELWRMIRARRG